MTTQPAVRNTVEVVYEYPTPTRDCVQLHDNNIESNKAAMNQRLSRVCQNADESYMQWEIEDYSSTEDEADKVSQKFSSDSLLTKLGIQDLDVVLRTSRMRWFGHVERSTGWIAEVRKLNVVAQKRSGRPRKSWDEVLENDRKKLGMDSADPQNRSEWRGRLRERLVKKPNPR